METTINYIFRCYGIDGEQDHFLAEYPCGKEHAEQLALNLENKMNKEQYSYLLEGDLYQTNTPYSLLIREDFLGKVSAPFSSAAIDYENLSENTKNFLKMAQFGVKEQKKVFISLTKKEEAASPEIDPDYMNDPDYWLWLESLDNAF